MLAPRIRGYYGAGDLVSAVDVAGVRIVRLDADLVDGRPRETVDDLIRRAADVCGTTEIFELVYDERQ